MLVAIGVDADGFREAVGAGEGYKESQDSWREFLLGMRQRGLSGARMAAGDKSAGMLGALLEVFPDATRRRRAARSCRNVLAKVPQRRRKAVAAQLKAVHAQESLAASARKAREVAGSLRTSKLSDAARVFEEGYIETRACARFPPEHWRMIRTNNGIERLNRETERRTKAVASFPDGEAAAMLAAARCSTWPKATGDPGGAWTSACSTDGTRGASQRARDSPRNGTVREAYGVICERVLAEPRLYGLPGARPAGPPAEPAGLRACGAPGGRAAGRQERREAGRRTPARRFLSL